MVTQSRIDPEAERFIRDAFLDDPNVKPAAVLRDMAKAQTGGEVDIRTMPVRVTVWRRLKELRDLDRSGPWRLQPGPAADAALVMPVLGAVISATQGRRAGLTHREAGWILAIRTAASDIGLWACYLMAARYVEYEAAERDTAMLDRLLAEAPWRARSIDLIRASDDFARRQGLPAGEQESIRRLTHDVIATTFAETVGAALRLEPPSAEDAQSDAAAKGRSRETRTIAGSFVSGPVDTG